MLFIYLIINAINSVLSQSQHVANYADKAPNFVFHTKGEITNLNAKVVTQLAKVAFLLSYIGLEDEAIPLIAFVAESQVNIISKPKKTFPKTMIDLFSANG